MRRNGKSANAFRTISEVARDIDVPAHVLRFWETKFTQIRPLKRGGGRRFYRPEDVKLLGRIRGLLYDHGYTIKGVQRLLRSGALPLEEQGQQPGLLEAPPAPAPKPAPLALDARQKVALKETLVELKTLRDLLAQATRR